MASKLRAPRPLLCLFAWLAPLLSCGGDVVVDGASAAPPGTRCAVICAKIAAACSNPPDCVAMCAPIDRFVAQGVCLGTVNVYLACLDQNPTFACPPSVDTCTDAEAAFVTCTENYCAGAPQSCH